MTVTVYQDQVREILVTQEKDERTRLLIVRTHSGVAYIFLNPERWAALQAAVAEPKTEAV